MNLYYNTSAAENRLDGSGFRRPFINSIIFYEKTSIFYEKTSIIPIEINRNRDEFYATMFYLQKLHELWRVGLLQGVLSLRKSSFCSTSCSRRIFIFYWRSLKNLSFSIFNYTNAPRAGTFFTMNARVIWNTNRSSVLRIEAHRCLHFIVWPLWSIAKRWSICVSNADFISFVSLAEACFLQNRPEIGPK